MEYSEAEWQAFCDEMRSQMWEAIKQDDEERKRRDKAYRDREKELMRDIEEDIE